MPPRNRWYLSKTEPNEASGPQGIGSRGAFAPWALRFPQFRKPLTTCAVRPETMPRCMPKNGFEESNTTRTTASRSQARLEQQLRAKTMLTRHKNVTKKFFPSLLHFSSTRHFSILITGFRVRKSRCSFNDKGG